MRPGVEVSSLASAPPVGVPTDTSVAFIVAEAQMGPVDKPTRVTSLTDFTNTYGARIPGTYGYDAVDAYFQEGATAAYFMRLADATADVATADGAAIIPQTTVLAANPGTWANALTLTIADTPTTTVLRAPTRRAKATNGEGKSEPPPVRGAGTPERSPLLHYDTRVGAGAFIAILTLDGEVVQTSQPLDTVGDVIAWATGNQYVIVAGGVDPTAPVTAGVLDLVGGIDGAVPVDDSGASLTNALAACPAELGPGQVLAPGKGTVPDYGALVAHAANSNRVALLDSYSGTDSVSDLALMAGTVRGAAEDRYGSMWAPWAIINGVAPGTTRTIPWSSIQAGLCARVDAAGDPDQAAAGAWGISRAALDLTTHYSPADAQTLLYAGVDTARSVYGLIEAYAYRTLSDPAGPRAGWLQLNWARLNMAITAKADAIGEDYVFSQLDGRGLDIAAFNGDLAGMLLDYYNDGALYAEPGSDDPTTAFVVNTGPAVNTPENIADGILNAVLSVRMSPHAELVKIAIVKVPITQSLV